MFNFLAGLAIGVVFAPFWMTVWTKFVSPRLTAMIGTLKK